MLQYAAVQGIHKGKDENVLSFLESFHFNKHRNTCILGIDGANVVLVFWISTYVQELEVKMVWKADRKKKKRDEGMKYGNWELGNQFLRGHHAEKFLTPAHEKRTNPL